MQASAITQEPSNHLDLFLSRIAHLSFPSVSSDYGHLDTPNSASFLAWYTRVCTCVREKKKAKRVVASLRLTRGGPASPQGLWNEFNKFIKFHCERFSYGFASVGGVTKSEPVSSYDCGGFSVAGENGDGEVRVVGEENRPKKILILMSDTGGGHRASAEAIKAAFNLEFGDEYQEELRRELGMDDELPAVLLMGGGEGMGPIEATAQALGDSLYNESLGEPIGQLIVICGRNKKLLSRLQSIKWQIPVQVLGFITKMEECMGACDCIITKAGPGTIAEAMIRGLPIILNGYIAGQEAGNVPYVVENGIGKFSKSPKQIAKIVAEWFGSKSDELKAMSQNAMKLARPDAVFKIVNDLHELVRHRSQETVQYTCGGSF